MAVLNFDIKTVALPSGEESKAVFLTGSIDASTNQTFEGRLSDILSSGTHNVMLVLTNVKYINSTGLGTIVKCVDNFREKGGDIKLVGVPTKVIALFEMLGLLALFETHDTIEAAVFELRQEQGGQGGGAADRQVPHPVQAPDHRHGPERQPARPLQGSAQRRLLLIDQNGTIEFDQISKVKMIEAKLPADMDFSAGLTSLAAGLATRLKLPAEVSTRVQRGIGDAAAIIRGHAKDANETFNILLVGDQDKLQVGIVGYGSALNIRPDDPGLKALESSVEDVKHTVLPTRGYLLTFTKRVR